MGLGADFVYVLGGEIGVTNVIQFWDFDYSLYEYGNNFNSIPRAFPAVTRLDPPSKQGLDQVLITGGEPNEAGNPARSTSEIFEPRSGFSVGPELSTVRSRHTATRLSSGEVLVAGGQCWLSSTQGLEHHDTAEIYDPGAKAFNLILGRLMFPRSGHTATLLSNGKVLLAGGVNGNGALNSAELYDPIQRTFSLTTSGLLWPRAGHTATVLDDGRVLIVGDKQGVTAQCELYDPATNTFTGTGDLAERRWGHQAVKLLNGKVLILGGAKGDTGLPVLPVEIYDPSTGRFSPCGSLNSPREGFTATLLSNGLVLILGGATKDVEIYNPGL